MGQSSSSATSSTAPASGGAGATGPTGRRSRFGGMGSTGRYYVLTAPNGVKVHVVGVYPCATLSEEEAADVVAGVGPAVVYVDVHPEMMAALVDEVAAGKVGRAHVPGETPPRFHKYRDAGWIASIKVRQLLADNEVFALMGAEVYGAYKAGIAAALSARPTPARLLPFPMAMDYNNGENMERPGHVIGALVGNAQFNSDTVFASLGTQFRLLTSAAGDITVPVQLPPDTMYFTRTQVTALQDRFRAAVNGAAGKLTVDSADAEVEAEALEARAVAAGDRDNATALHTFNRRAQYQSQAIVGALHKAALELPPSASMVAVMNLGAAASLRRNWGEGRSVEELFPPLSPYMTAAVYTAQGALVAGVGYGWYRAVRRFPKSVTAATLVAAGLGGLTAYGILYAETMMYGQAVRSALARPRVASSVARINATGGK